MPLSERATNGTGGQTNQPSVALFLYDQISLKKTLSHTKHRDKKIPPSVKILCEVTGLKKIEAGLTKKNGIKVYEKVIERIGRLKERYSRTARHFEITVQKNDQDRVTSLSWSLKKDIENTDGVYCLRTNRQGVNEQELWDFYNIIRDVEDAFRCMKSDLGFRPIRHHIERRSDGHLFITVLAYHILHAIRFKLRKKGIPDSWATIRERLSMHTRISTTQKREDGKVIHIRKSSRIEPHQKVIYDALNIASAPGQMVKKIL